MLSLPTMGIQSHEAIEALYNLNPKEDQGMKLVPAGQAEKTIVIAAGLPWPKITLTVKAVDDNGNLLTSADILPMVRWFVLKDGRKTPLCLSRFNADGTSQSDELVKLAYGTHQVLAEIPKLKQQTEFTLHIKHDIKPTINLKGIRDPATGQVEAVVPYHGTSRPLTLTTLRQPGDEPEPHCQFVITASPNIFFSAQFDENYARPIQRIVGQTDHQGRFNFLVINEGTNDAKLKVRTITTELVYRLPVETIEDPPLGPISIISGDGEATEDIPNRFQGGDEISVPLDATDPEFPLPEGNEGTDPFQSQELESLTLDESETGEIVSPGGFQAVGTPGFAKTMAEHRASVAEANPEFTRLERGFPPVEKTVEPEAEEPAEEAEPEIGYGATESVFFEKGEAINSDSRSVDDEEEPIMDQVFDDVESLEMTRPFQVDRPTPIVLLSALGIVALIGTWFLYAETLIPNSDKPWFALTKAASEPEGADDGDVYTDDDGYAYEELEPATTIAEDALATKPDPEPEIVIEDEPAESDDALSSAEPIAKPIEPESEEPDLTQQSDHERDTLPGCWRFTGINLTEGGLNVRACVDPDITTTCLGFYHRGGTRISPYGCFTETELPAAQCQSVRERSERANTWIEMSGCNDGIDRICADETGPDGSYLYCTARSAENPNESRFCHDYQLSLDADGVPYLIITGCPDGNTYKCLAAPDNLDSKGKFHGNCQEHTL